MASAGALRAGRAVIELSLLTGPVEKGLKRLQAKVQSIGAGFTKIGSIGLSAGGALLGAFAATAKVFTNAGSQLDDMSKRTGFSVETLSALDYAAGQSGTSLESVEKASRGMARQLLAAENGSEGANANLAALGLTIEQLRGLKPEDQFTLIADRLSKVSDPSQRAAMAMKMFGKSGTELIPLLKDGKGGISALMSEARELGVVMSSDDATAAEKLGDVFEQLRAQFKAFVIQIGAAVSGDLLSLAQRATAIGASAISWVNANRALIATVAKVAAVVTIAGAALVGIGTTFTLIGVAAGGFAAAISLGATVLGAIISPVGLVVAAVAGLATWFLTSTEAGNTLVSKLSAGFGQLWEIAKGTIGGIGDALAAGDIQLAGEILWSGLKLLWLQGTEGLRATWHAFTGGIAKVWHTVWAGMLQLANSVWGNLERGWSHFAEFFANVWEQDISMLKRTLNTLVAFFQKTWLRIKGVFGNQVQGEIDRINRELETANSKIRDATAASRNERGENAAAARERSRHEQDATLDVIGADLAAKLANADTATQQKIAAEQRELRDLRARWADARKAAEDAKKVVEAFKNVDSGVFGLASGSTAGLGGIAGLMGVAVAAAIQNLRDTSVTGVDTAIAATKAPEAIFDTRFAAQIFGGGRTEDEQLFELRAIKKELRKKQGQPGIPVI